LIDKINIFELNRKNISYNNNNQNNNNQILDILDLILLNLNTDNYNIQPLFQLFNCILKKLYQNNKINTDQILNKKIDNTNSNISNNNILL